MDSENRDSNINSQTSLVGADLVPLPAPAAVPPLPVPLAAMETVREYIRASKAESTLRGYSADWREFCAWTEARGLAPIYRRLLRR